jgi:hypothetical protein
MHSVGMWYFVTISINADDFHFVMCLTDDWCSMMKSNYWPVSHVAGCDEAGGCSVVLEVNEWSGIP